MSRAAISLSPTDRAAFTRALDLLDEPAWEPYPWQVCPSPIAVQGVFLIEGGRGIGKTDGCAHYMLDHVRGPACDPRVPGGHRMAIVAPTLDDAAESCVNGPSGLRSYNPAVILRTALGGSKAIWPNGAEAKLFSGASEKDADRLRAGGNRCLAAGSMIATEHGPVAIEQVHTGDRVWTRNGLRLVLRAGQTGFRSTVDIGGLRMTSDHLIATPGNGWQYPGVANRIVVWDGLSFSGTASAGSSVTVATTPAADAACCTGRSTRSITGQSHPAGMCTTETTARRTTTRQIWSRLTRALTGMSTAPSGATRGTQMVAEQSGWGEKQRSEAVSFVAASIAHDRPAPGFAVLAAETLERRHERTPNGCVSCVANGSLPRDVIRPRLAVHRVDRPTPTHAAEPVYDLLVEHDHEFFANGVLVANCLVWIEEAAAIPWLDVAVKQARYGLRVGRNAHMVASSTPRPTPAYKQLRADPTTVRTHGTTDLAIHLDPAVRQRLYDDYAGTRLGRQELLGELLEDVEGALWGLSAIDVLRVDKPPAMSRVVVAIDPSGGDTEEHDEQGIVVAGHGVDGDFYVLADRSCKESPSGWAARAIGAYHEFSADLVVAESNYGGAMVQSTLHNVDAAVPVRMITASRGKRQRAEPVSALYEQGRVHHVGSFGQLEDQMCSWVPESGRSPDRMDALVWALTQLAVPARTSSVMTFAGRVA